MKTNLMHNFTVDPVGLEIRDMLNVDNLMWSRVFPAAHGTWPRSAYAIEEQFAKAGVPDGEKRRMLADNAVSFFGLSPRRRRDDDRVKRVTSDAGGSVPPVEVQRRLYELMVLMKAADDRLSKGIGSGEFVCVYWPPRGQEAIAAAMGVALRSDDQLVTTYRGLHDLIGKGVPLVEIYGEMLGRQVGAGRGKGGTMHIARPESGVMMSTGIVGPGRRLRWVSPWRRSARGSTASPR